MELKMNNEKAGKAYFEGNTYSDRFIIQSIAGSEWDRKTRRWEVPLDAVGDVLRMLPGLVIEAEVLKSYKALTERQAKAVAQKNKSTEETTVTGLKGRLYPYQATGKAFLDTMGEGEGKILAFDMGLGKSLTSIATFLAWQRKGLADYCLVVCPSPLKYSTWAKELEKWTTLPYTVVDGDRSEVVEWEDGTKERLKGQRLREVQYAQWQFGSTVIVVNYELFLRDMAIMPPVDGRWVVILDECQRIKNPKAQTTKNILKVAKNAGRRILGSGTPLENNIQELWSLVELCKPGLLGKYHKFVERYCELDYFGSPMAPKQHMLPELNSKLEPIIIRKTKEEALPELPELTIQDYWVGMTEEQQKLYSSVKAGILETMQGDYTYLEALAQITRLQQVVDSPYLLRNVIGNDKLPKQSGKLIELKSIIKDLDPHKNKFILFTQYREMSDILYQWLIEEKLLRPEEIGYIHGGLKATVSAGIQASFQSGNVKCILMTTAGNYGLDLSAGSYVICYDQLFNPQKMAQIHARAHRNGAKSAVHVINILTKNTYEEKKLSILAAKKDIFNKVVNGSEDDTLRILSKEDIMAMI